MGYSIEIIHTQYQILINGWPLVDIVATFSIPALFIGWWLSSRARKESARANMLQLLPIITLEPADNNSEVQVWNIGSSPATNIKVDSYYHPVYDDFLEKKRKVLSLKFKKVPLLAKGGYKIPECTAKESKIISDEIPKGIMINSKYSLTFTVRYKDITGMLYVTRIKIIDAVATIVTPPTKYSLRRKIMYIYDRLKEQIIINTKVRWLLLKIKREDAKKRKK